MRSKILFIIAIIGLGASASFTASAMPASLAQKLSGRILLQVETKGQAWYVNPSDQKRYFLGRPIDAWQIMRALGVGITNDDLAKIPTKDQSAADISFARLNAGKIFLQVQNSGQAWYVNPVNYKRYYLGRPADAFEIMRDLALGITNNNLEQIPVGQIQIDAPAVQPPAASSPETPTVPEPDQPPPAIGSALDQAAASIRSGNSALAQTFFVPSMRKSIEYSLKNLSSESRLLLANILSGANLSSSSETEKIYSTKAYFSLGGYEVPLKFYVKKQADGEWLIENL